MEISNADHDSSMWKRYVSPYFLKKKINHKIEALLQIHFTIFTLPPTTMSTTVTQDKYQAVREDIIKVFPKEDYDDGSLAPVM